MTADGPYWVSGEGDVTLYLGDCLDVLRGLPADSVDAIVTDPPYGLAEIKTEMVVKALTAWLGGDRLHVPDGRGFMGREWDKFVPPPGIWDEALRVLKPGGHLLSFAGTRMSDLMMLSIRLAGFKVFDSVADLTGQDAPGLMWIHGQGFPKSRDIGKDIDKAGGQNVSWFGPWLRQERERRGISSHELCERGGFYKNVNHGGLVVNWELGLGIPTAAQFNKVCEILELDYPRIEVLEREVIAQGYRIRRESTVQIAGTSDGAYDLTAPATPEAARWDGWGTALKPAWEPIVVARKPLSEGSVAGNVLKWGTGGLNVDGCRVEGTAWTRPGGENAGKRGGIMGETVPRVPSESNPAGRWPANVVLSHSAGCVPAGTRQVNSGHGKVIASKASGADGAGNTSAAFGAESRTADSPHPRYGDEHGWETVEVWVCDVSCPVGELDRQSGMSQGVAGNMRQTDGKVTFTVGEDINAKRFTRSADRVKDFGGASRFYPVFKYQAKAPASERPRLEDGTAHETVKPLGLICWLVRLVTPPGGTVLDMFAGSGPVGEAAVIEGFRCVLIEKERKSADLIRKRLGKPIQPVMFGLEA